MKQFIFFYFFVILAGGVKSQKNIEVYVPFRGYAGNSKLLNFGLGVRANYFFDDWTSLYGGSNYYFPAEVNGTIEVIATNGTVVPSSLIKDVNSRLRAFEIIIGLKRYFYGDYIGGGRKKVGLYGRGGFSLLFGSTISEIPEYDRERYESPILEETEGGFVNYIASVGLGGDFHVKKLCFFTEFSFGGTLNQANRTLVDVELPLFIQSNIGLRFSIGASD